MWIWKKGNNKIKMNLLIKWVYFFPIFFSCTIFHSYCNSWGTHNYMFLSFPSHKNRQKPSNQKPCFETKHHVGQTIEVWTNKGCLAQILLDAFLNTLTHMIIIFSTLVENGLIMFDNCLCSQNLFFSVQ